MSDFSTFHVNMFSKHFQQQQPKPELKPTYLDDLDGFSWTFDGNQQFVDACGSDFQQVVSACENSCACVDSFACCDGLQKHGQVCGVCEFSKTCGSVWNSSEMFQLHPLFKLDDMEHFRQRVWDEFQLGLYDVVESNGFQKGCRRLGDATVVQCSAKPHGCDEFFFPANA